MLKIDVLKSLAVCLTLALIICIPVIMSGCGSSPAASSSTSTVTTVSVKGTSSTSSTSSSSLSTSSLRVMAALAGAAVTISKPSEGSYDVTEVATGTTDTDGSYSIDVDVSKIEELKDASDKVNNLIVSVSKDGTTVGCVLPSIGTDAGEVGYAPTADSDRHKKSLIARSAFKKGMDPKDFDYDSKIDRKFTDLSDYSADEAGVAKFDKMADAIKGAEAARSEIASALGISTANLALLDVKARELHDTYVEPIFKTAFDNKTEPDKTTLDTAFANMEKAMKDYAISLGLTEQQFMDLKSMHDKGMAAEMRKGGMGDEPAFKEMERRDMGNKIIDLFNAQYDAADALANATRSDGGTSFKDANAAGYASFVAAKSVVLAALKTKMEDTTMTNPGEIGQYLRENFFDAYIFPPPTMMPGEGSEIVEGGKGDMNAIMSGYSTSRIMVYFMLLLPADQRNALFMSMGSSMQPIFNNRFSNTSSPYYMGPEFWNTYPTPEQINTRLTAFQAALDAAVNTAIGDKFSIFGTNADRYKAAFKILNAPPDAM